MITAAIEPTFTDWRDKARELLRRGVRPEDVCWEDATQGCGLLPENDVSDAVAFVTAEHMRVPPGFLSLASQVCAHTDERRFGVLYRLLHRLTLGGRRHLLSMPSDADTRQCQMWAKAVSREIHHMHAYVRFRLVGVDEETGREQFVAWFEPEFRVVRLAAPFFEKRFAGMDWSILTPDECVSWDGSELLFMPGMRKEDAPAGDAHDDLWRTYYRSVFNPARLKVQTMQSSMPRKYWKNMPETQSISELIASSQSRVTRMLETPERPLKPLPDNAYLRSLRGQASRPGP
ncbi:MAG: TIGR03915 family putative DNA repair protein [Prosthecobacter sp.]